MVQPAHIELLKQGAEHLASWRQTHGAVRLDLSGADLRGHNLSEADLRGSDFRGADLRGCSLRWSDLHHALLGGADLRGADLHHANLNAADLRGADLRGADLREANLTEANLKDADTRGCLMSPSPGAGSLHSHVFGSDAPGIGSSVFTTSVIEPLEIDPTADTDLRPQVVLSHDPEVTPDFDERYEATSLDEEDSSELSTGNG